MSPKFKNRGGLGRTISGSRATSALSPLPNCFSPAVAIATIRYRVRLSGTFTLTVARPDASVFTAGENAASGLKFDRIAIDCPWLPPPPFSSSRPESLLPPRPRAPFLALYSAGADSSPPLNDSAALSAAAARVRIAGAGIGGAPPGPGLAGACAGTVVAVAVLNAPTSGFASFTNPRR